MRPTVLDASVVAKLVFPEHDSDRETDRVATLVAQGVPLHAPDLLFTEVASVAARKVRRREATARDARDLLRVCETLGIRTWPGRDLAPAALEIAMTLGCSVYDATYLALAVHLDADLATADKVLERAATRLGRRLPP